MRRVRSVLAHFASQRAMNFALVDQVMVSGANFLAGILLARALGIFEFGRFALAWMFVEFLGSLQTAAIIQPMLNIGPKQAEADGARYYQTVLAQQGAICIVFGLLAWSCATLAGWLFSDAAFDRLSLPLGAAIMAYQLQCFFRRYFFACDRPITALINDGLRFMIQVSAMATLALGWSASTADIGLWILAAACGLAAFHGFLHFGRFDWHAVAFIAVVARHWNFSKWLLPSALMYWLTAQGFPLMSGFVLGASATGGLQAAFSIVGITNVLLLALDNFAPVRAARTLHTGGPIQLHGNIVGLALLTLTLVVAMIAVINVDPRCLLHLLYGGSFEHLGALVRWLSASVLVTALSAVLIVWAAAIERTHVIFTSYAAATVFTVAAAYPLTRYGGLTGVVAGALLVEAIRATVLLASFVRWSREIRSDEPRCTATAKATEARERRTLKPPWTRTPL